MKMTNVNKKVINKMKSLIDKNGLEYLHRNPYMVYKELTASSGIDEKHAGVILLALVRGIDQKLDCYDNAGRLAELIQNECCLNEEMSVWLSEILSGLFSKENEEEWNEMRLNGWKHFLNSTFGCTWKGFSIWNVDGGSVDCHFEADFQLKAVAELCADKELAQSLCENPFMTHEEIVEYYKKNIIKYLDFEFEEYCTCDDYYQPVVEDFDIEYYVKEWCKKNKFIVMSCEGNGYDNGYEPSFRRF